MRWLMLTLALSSVVWAASEVPLMMDEQALYDAIDKHRQQYIALLRELIQASEDGEAAVQSLVARRFGDLGCEVETLELLPTRLSLEKEFAAEEAIDAVERITVVGKLAGTGGGKSLLFFGHPDPELFTDESKKAWRHDPFAGTVEGNKIYGWGVADDLAGVAIMAGALDAVLKAAGRPRGDIYLGSTPAKRNARGILGLLDEGYAADAAVYLHPAESEAGLRDLKAITSGMLQFRIKVVGAPPDTREPGQTAFAHMATSAIDKTDLVLDALKKLDAVRARRVHHPALQQTVGRSTNLLVSQLACGEQGSLTKVPTHCLIGASLTFPPNEELKQVKNEIEEMLDSVAQSDPWLRDNPPAIDWLFGTQGVEVPAEHPLYKTVSTAVADVTGETPVVNPLHSASDIRNPLLFRGIPTVGLGPLAGDFTQAGGHDEWVDVDDYIKAIKICAKVILDWCR